MKRGLLILSLFAAIAAAAQRSNVESAAIYFRNLEMEDAKKSIDEASVNDETKNDSKMWFYYAQIYDTLNRNPGYSNLDKDIVEKFIIGCKKCIDADVKKKYKYYCGYAIVNSGFAAYNKAIEYYGKNDVANASKFFQYVIDIFPYDENKDLTKNNINEKSIIYSLAGLALNNKNYPEAKKHLNKLIDLNYNDHVIYLLLSNLYMEERDTTKALEAIEMGKSRFNGEKDLINQELYIYQAMGRTDFLLQKYNEALENDPENTLYLFNRGAMQDMINNDLQKRAKHSSDTADKIANKAKTEKIPGNKVKLAKAAKNYKLLSDSLFKQSKVYIAKAEADYKKVIEVNPDYLDAYYNLGALYNNQTTELAEKMEALNYSAADYQKKFDALKKEQDAILKISLGYLNKALELADQMPEDDEAKKKFKKETQYSIISSLQNVYKNFGDEKKTMEMMKRKKEVE